MHENQQSGESKRESELASVVGRYGLAESDAKAMMGNAKELPKAVLDRLNKLAQLPENWDRYGSNRISRKAIEETRSILRRAYGIGGPKLPAPLVSPTPDGGVGLEWKLGSGKELFLEVSSEGSGSYLLVIPSQRGEEEIEGDIRSPKELDELLHILNE